MVGETMNRNDEMNQKNLGLINSNDLSELLAEAVLNPASYFICGYHEPETQVFKSTLNDALLLGKPFIGYARADLMVLDLDRKYFENTNGIQIVIDELLKFKIRFVLTNSGTGYHLFINKWSIPGINGDIDKPGLFVPANQWVQELFEALPLSNFSFKEALREGRMTRTPVSPHKDGLSVGMVFPDTAIEADSNLRHLGLLGTGIRKLSSNALAMIHGYDKYATQGRSQTNQSLALAMANYGYIYEDFEWIILKSKTNIARRNEERRLERGRSIATIKTELQQAWAKAVARAISRPAQSANRDIINEWWMKQLKAIGLSNIGMKTKIRYQVFVTQVAVDAYRTNSLDFVKGISKFSVDSQLSEASLYRYKQTVTNVCQLTISRTNHLKKLGIATTRYQLTVDEPKKALSPVIQEKALLTNYTNVKNRDNSAVIESLSQGLPQTLYIDLGVISDQWHPHDAWFATKITGGMAGKLLWHLTQALTEGTFEDLCNLLEPTSNYFHQTITTRLLRAGLFEINEFGIEWSGDGTLLESLAELANVIGTQRKRILQIEKKQEEREIALQEYYNRHLQRQSDLLDAFITPLEGIQSDEYIVDELLEEGDF
jgi:hypothetical protein